MGKIFELENIIQHYAWGDKDAFRILFGIENPKDEPQAEIWMGSHPKAPSVLIDDDKKITFLDYINMDPVAALGEQSVAKFSSQLPFLFKVLSASKPLSIQSHPNLEQARIGFAKDNASGIPLTAYNRNYKDKNHKPELIYAITPFKALNGFRKIDSIIDLFDRLNIEMVKEPLETFKKNRSRSGLISFYTWIMTLTEEQVYRLTTDAVAMSENNKTEPAFEVLLQLNTFYPNDIGIMGALILNVVKLEPGQAMFLGDGELHAYIEGTGMEIMANSDNVLRGGLTPKHVDVAELLSTLTFNSGDVKILVPEPSGRKGEIVYHTPATEFEFSVISLDNEQFSCGAIRSAEILFCGVGSGIISFDDNEKTIKAGMSYLVPASVTNYTLSGSLTVYKACVP